MSACGKRRAHWNLVCREFRERGMTRTALCEAHATAGSTLGYWLNPARDTSVDEAKRKEQCTDPVAVGAWSPQ